MKTSTDQIGAALNMYYEGMSLNAIRRQLDQTHRNYPSDSTVYEWIERFSKEAISEAKKYTPNVGDVWVADETVLKIDGKNIWFWDIIDAKTRFLLASHVSANRGTREAKALMEKAQARAGKTPKVVLTDKLAAYIDGIEQAFGADAKHIQSKPFTVKDSTNLIERFHGTLKDRTKVMRGLKEIETAKLFTDGWLVHYNFFRPHETLGKTPAEAAGITFAFKNWLGVVNQPRIIVSKLRIEDVVSPKPHKTRVQPFRFPEIAHRQQPMSNAIYAHGSVLSRRPFAGSRKIAQGRRGGGILLKM
jgi:transposase-like protein